MQPAGIFLSSLSHPAAQRHRLALGEKQARSSCHKGIPDLHIRCWGVEYYGGDVVRLPREESR